MKKLFLICLILLLCASSASGTTIGSSDSRITIGAMTGPRTGAEQDDNIKASLDLLHGKIAATLATGGSIFYVDSGTAGSAGTSWGTAVGTIELAIAECTDAAGDLILCAPYHAETGSTEGFDLDKDGITVWALGTGIARATITYDTAEDTVILGADGDNCTIHGLRFVSSVTAVAFAIVVEDGCTDFIIEDCEFSQEATGTDEFIDAIYIHGTAANNGIIRRNRFLGDAGANAGPQSSIGFEDAHFLQIYDNEFSGDIAVAHIENKTTAANFVTIRDNRILCGYIGDAASTLDTTPGITLVNTTTGWIQDNFIVTNVATPDLAIVAADCYLSGNTYNELQGSAFAAVGIGYVPGRTYVVKMQMAVAHTDDLFTVVGGPILITNLMFYVTGDCDGTNTWTIFLDAGDGQDIDLSDSVDIATVNDGDRILFSNANPAALTILAQGANVGSASLMTGWYIEPGVLEVVNANSTQAGLFDVYMTFIPLAAGITVTPM